MSSLWANLSPGSLKATCPNPSNPKSCTWNQLNLQKPFHFQLNLVSAKLCYILCSEHNAAIASPTIPHLGRVWVREGGGFRLKVLARICTHAYEQSSTCTYASTCTYTNIHTLAHQHPHEFACTCIKLHAHVLNTYA